jgi:hypothetical protein
MLHAPLEARDDARLTEAAAQGFESGLILL